MPTRISRANWDRTCRSGSWNQALVAAPAGLATRAATVTQLGADALEIDRENGTPEPPEIAGAEAFIAAYNALTDAVLTLDLAVGNRYLQALSRRANTNCVVFDN